MTSIAILGTGSALRDFLSILPEGVDVAGLGDNDPKKQGTLVEGYRVYAPATVAAWECELFVIAGRAVDEIRGQLMSLGVSPDKICAYYPSYSKSLRAQANDDVQKLSDTLGISLPEVGISTMYLWPDEPGSEALETSGDFVRTQSFRMCAQTIGRKSIPGSIAELGVYQGEQAALLNRLFPSRRLHLFDTFEGFSPNDLSTERESGFSGAAEGDFADTSVDLVLAKMAHRDVIEVHKGFFPATTHGIEDTFAFVSLDVDLYEPTLAGLEWFYPRLSKGGYIFVHDYNNRRYIGVRNAVDKFVAESGAITFAIPDFAGSIVILK